MASQDKIPRKYSTVSSRTRFIRASYPFNTPVTIPLNKYNSQPTLTSTLEFDSNSLILILLKIKNELLLSLQSKNREKEITMREEWSWRICYLLQLVEDRETWLINRCLWGCSTRFGETSFYVVDYVAIFDWIYLWNRETIPFLIQIIIFISNE